MRLDTYLVREKIIASRSRAQRAIKNGFVTVDNRTVLKPAFDVTAVNIVAVETAADRPAGYWKLKAIQETFGLIKRGDIVLDIGASAGGFLLYAAELADAVYALEFSASFEQALEAGAKRYPDKIHVIYADAFSFDFASLGVTFDVILNDISAAPNDSLKVLSKSAAVLKTGGHVLQVLKGVNERNFTDLKRRFEECGFITLKISKNQKRELYVIGEKRANEANAEEGI